jgi:hypothetical protein
VNYPIAAIVLVTALRRPGLRISTERKEASEGAENGSKSLYPILRADDA